MNWVPKYVLEMLQAITVAFPIKYFHLVTLAVAEHEQLLGKRICVATHIHSYVSRFNMCRPTATTQTTH